MFKAAWEIGEGFLEIMATGRQLESAHVQVVELAVQVAEQRRAGARPAEGPAEEQCM